MSKKSVVIGFCGGLGSGKSTLANKIKDEFKDKATVVYMDTFCKYQPEGKDVEAFSPNEPDEFNVDLMVRCVSDLKAGNDTFFPVYGFSSLRSDERPWVDVKSTPIIILDGELLFAIPEIRDLIDIKIFVDTDADIRIMRRIRTQAEADLSQIGQLVESYLTEDKPTHDLYIEPYKGYADIIIPQGGDNRVAVEMLCSLLRERIA